MYYVHECIHCKAACGRHQLHTCHSSLFQSLKLNRIELEESTDSHPHGGAARPKKKKKSYDLNSTDNFWQNHKGSPFPNVAEAVQEELEAYRAKEDEVTRLKHAMVIILKPKQISDFLTFTLFSDKSNSGVFCTNFLLSLMNGY